MDECTSFHVVREELIEYLSSLSGPPHSSWQQQLWCLLLCSNFKVVRKQMELFAKITGGDIFYVAVFLS